jgi:hypothetical protein
MTPREPVDANGQKVITFAANVRTLGKLGELADHIMTMAESGAWRQYRTAVGTDTWLDCEFDYFLIACDLDCDDVHRAIKWHRLGETTRAMMDQNAQPPKRRPLEQAATAYHAAGPETLIQKAERLHWISKRGMPRSPLSHRTIVRMRHGMTKDEYARRMRERDLPIIRRNILAQRAATLIQQISDPTELRYVVDLLREHLAGLIGRPSKRTQWRKDIIAVNGNREKLAARWKVSRTEVRDRLRKIRSKRG